MGSGNVVFSAMIAVQSGLDRVTQMSGVVCCRPAILTGMGHGEPPWLIQRLTRVNRMINLVLSTATLFRLCAVLLVAVWVKRYICSADLSIGTTFSCFLFDDHRSSGRCESRGSRVFLCRVEYYFSLLGPVSKVTDRSLPASSTSQSLRISCSSMCLMNSSVS